MRLFGSGGTSDRYCGESVDFTPKYLSGAEGDLDCGDLDKDAIFVGDLELNSRSRDRQGEVAAALDLDREIELLLWRDADLS